LDGQFESYAIRGYTRKGNILSVRKAEEDTFEIINLNCVKHVVLPDIVKFHKDRRAKMMLESFERLKGF
jgi:hypothetical protein